MDRETKDAALSALAQHLQASFDALAASQHAVQAGATHEETRAENEKDTRATEASYLARGLAERTEALGDAITILEAFAPPPPDGSVSVGSLVELEDASGAARRYLIAPVGGGTRLELAGGAVQVLTPNAPLARALLGCEELDEVRVPGREPGELATITGVA